MRSIGHLPDEQNARVFGDFLVVEGIPNDIEADGSGHWTVWVHEDDHLARAESLLNGFRLNPGDPKYRRAAPEARQLREKEQQEQTAYAKRFHDRRSVWRGMSGRVGWLTAALLAASVGVTILKSLRGEGDPVVQSLFITHLGGSAEMIGNTAALPEIRRGEVWRLITPIFIHFGVIHLLFNMLWLLDLGGMIETRLGPARLAALVLVIAALSNLGQYYQGGPAFGGMSGVVYGLFGYIWLRSKFDPGCGLAIHPTNVTLMIVWFFACMTGFVGPVANTAHAVGLGVGLVWGFLAGNYGRGR